MQVRVLVFPSKRNGRYYARLAVMLTLSEVTIGFYVKFWVENSPNIILQSNMERLSGLSAVYSGAKCQLWQGVRRSDAVTWTRVAGMSDGSAGGPALFYVWNARALVDVPL